MAKAPGNPIDKLMDEASEALLATEYFTVVKLCKRALERARAADDFERMSRIVLPLQEARRQIRQIACDAGPRLLVTQRLKPSEMQPGLYLCQVPMIAAELARGHLVEILPGWLPQRFGVYAVWPSNPQRAGLTQRFIDFMASRIQRLFEGPER